MKKISQYQAEAEERTNKEYLRAWGRELSKNRIRHISFIQIQNSEKYSRKLGLYMVYKKVNLG